MKLNLYNSIPRATTKFALPSKAEIRSDAKVSCPFCHKEDLSIGASGGLAQHVFFGGYHFCEASGKSLEKACLLRLDENFNVVNDNDMVDDDAADDDVPVDDI